MAVLLAFANGFVLVAVQGAVGAIERAQNPFADWMLYSTILVPIFGLAIVMALARADRRGRHTVRTALLVAAITTGIGITLLTISIAYDYHLQAELLTKTASVHNHTVGGADGAQNPAYADDGWSPELRQTMLVAVKGFGLGTLILTGGNAFLVLWVTALRGGRLSRSR